MRRSVFVDAEMVCFARTRRVDVPVGISYVTFVKRMCSREMTCNLCRSTIDF